MSPERARGGPTHRTDEPQGHKGELDDLILVGELPPEFGATVGRDLADYTIAFLQVEADALGQANLLGSGVLVAVEDTSAILTAHHVPGVAPHRRSARCGLQ